jgi:hypothetical protein
MARLVAVAEPLRETITESARLKGDAQGLKDATHRLISGFCIIDRLVANAARGFLSAFHFRQHTGGFPNFCDATAVFTKERASLASVVMSFWPVFFI